MDGKYLVVTIDTEEDMPNWRPEKVPSLKNILKLPDLQKKLDAHGAYPTFLVDRPVIDDNTTCSIIRTLSENEKCEIGMHLHSWNTPPMIDEEYRGKATYLHTLPLELQREKIEGLYSYFGKRLGLNPKSYRAGRYGFNMEIARILYELEFEVDSSIVPLKDYSTDGGPDFRMYNLQPFFIEGLSNTAPLLEIPLTVDFINRIPGFDVMKYFSIPKWTRLKGILNRLNMAKISNLRPTTFSYKEMKELADHVLDNTNCPLLNIMFHSSECLPAATPYNQNEKDVSQFLERLFQIIKYLIMDRSLKGITLTEFASLAKKMKFNEIPIKKIID